MTQPDLDLLTADERALWEAEEKMTPGPWVFAPYDKRLVSEVTAEVVGLSDADCNGIPLARNSIRPLLEELIRLRKEIERIKDKYEEALDCIQEDGREIARLKKETK